MTSPSGRYFAFGRYDIGDTVDAQTEVEQSVCKRSAWSPKADTGTPAASVRNWPFSDPTGPAGDVCS